MMTCKESNGTLQRTVTVIIRPTPTEIADAIWNLDTSEQIMLLGCLKRRFCDKYEGLLQMASIANGLSEVSTEKYDEVKAFVTKLREYIKED